MAELGREEIEQYLGDLGMGETLANRALEVIENVKKLLPDPLLHIFVAEYRDEEGNRNYENLWLLTEEHMSEVHSFLTEDRFDVVSAHNGLVRIEVSKEHFDFKTATEQSRLAIGISFPPSGSMGLSGSFRASGDNCLALFGILQSYLLPMLQLDH